MSWECLRCQGRKFFGTGSARGANRTTITIQNFFLAPFASYLSSSDDSIRPRQQIGRNLAILDFGLRLIGLLDDWQVGREIFACCASTTSKAQRAGRKA